MKRRWCLAFLLCSSSAVAQTVERDAGRSVFSAGREAMRRGDRATACKMYRESHRIDPLAIGPIVNLAECEEADHALVSAQALYARALELLPAEDERVATTRARRTAVEARIPKVTFRCSHEHTGGVSSPRASGCDGAEILLDGVNIPAVDLGRPRRLDPGRHLVVVRKAGRADHRASFGVMEGALAEIELSLGARIPLDVPPMPPKVSGRERAILGGAIAGAGLAAVAFGIAGRLVAADYNREFRAHCDGLACDEQGLAAGDAGKTWTIAGTSAIFVGVVSLGLGGYFLFSKPEAPKVPKTTPPALARAPRYLLGEF